MVPPDAGSEDAGLQDSGSGDSGSGDSGSGDSGSGDSGSGDAGRADGGGSCPLERPPWGRGGDLMLPGSDCLSCHREGGAASLQLTIAGTVFSSSECPVPLEGAVVHIVDADGLALDLTSNEAGNFFTASALSMPLEISVEHDGVVVEKPISIGAGSCNSCHAPERQGYVSPSP